MQLTPPVPNKHGAVRQAMTFPPRHKVQGVLSVGQPTAGEKDSVRMGGMPPATGEFREHLCWTNTTTLARTVKEMQ